uniref:Uncharacterized protein n=1 Tax=Triticum urartu TaxID=4572 RepID=A0A8R7TPC0_TRIUA
MELAVWRFVFYSPPFKGVKGKHPVGVVCSSDHLQQHHIIKVPNSSAALLPSGEAMYPRGWLRRCFCLQQAFHFDVYSYTHQLDVRRLHGASRVRGASHGRCHGSACRYGTCEN